jgi:hypothetical protein
MVIGILKNLEKFNRVFNRVYMNSKKLKKNSKYMRIFGDFKNILQIL